MNLPGSYANGFAPRDGQPLYPELWRGCVGAWSPCLGPTGLTLRDWSGYGNHGTLTNGAAFTVSGGSNAIAFDASNDYVAVGGSGVYNFDRTQQVSLSAWVRPSSVAGVAYGVIDKSSLSPPNAGWSMVLFNRTSLVANAVSLFLTNTTTTNEIEVCSPAGSISASRWQHICATYDGTSTAAGVQIYINGIAQTKTTTRNNLSASITTSISPSIGARQSGAGQVLNGAIADCAIHYRVLSANEINILASRRGIAYEQAPRRRSSVQVITGNRRRRLLIGASS